METATGRPRADKLQLSSSARCYAGTRQVTWVTSASRVIDGRLLSRGGVRATVALATTLLVPVPLVLPPSASSGSGLSRRVLHLGTQHIG